MKQTKISFDLSYDDLEDSWTWTKDDLYEKIEELLPQVIGVPPETLGTVEIKMHVEVIINKQ